MPAANGSGNLGTELDGAFCNSTTDCYAFGVSMGTNSTSPILEHWNGSVWSLVSVPLPAGVGGRFHGIACASATACFLVGESITTGPHDRVFVARGHGTSWSVQAVPAPTGGENSVFNGIACASPTSCTAVGSAGSKTLVERWNGSSWAIVAAPSPGTTNELDAVACSAPASCTAVGTRFSSAGESTLALRWSGTSWAVQASANPGTDSMFAAVSCPSAARCVAVGTAGNEPLVEIWNGTKWTAQASAPPPVNASATVTGVACSATTCLATASVRRDVGLQTSFSDLIERSD